MQSKYSYRLFPRASIGIKTCSYFDRIGDRKVEEIPTLSSQRLFSLKCDHDRIRVAVDTLGTYRIAIGDTDMMHHLLTCWKRMTFKSCSARSNSNAKKADQQRSSKSIYTLILSATCRPSCTALSPDLLLASGRIWLASEQPKILLQSLEVSLW